MLLSRRALSAASRAVPRSLSRTPPLTRLYTSQAAPKAPPPQQAAAKTTPPKAYSNWNKPKPAAKQSPIARNVSTKTPATEPAAAGAKPAAELETPVPYEAKTVAHQAGDDASQVLDSATVDCSTGFHGISAKPVTEEQFKILMAPIPVLDIEVKPDGVIYLPEIKYRRKLNETFGPMGWGLIPKSEAVVGNGIVTREYALFADGRFVSQAQGENPFFSDEQLPSAVEGCKSNALMRCCKDLGIGSELWDPHYIRWFKKTHMEEVWVEHVTTKKKRTFWYRKGGVDVAYPYKLAK